MAAARNRNTEVSFAGTDGTGCRNVELTNE